MNNKDCCSLRMKGSEVYESKMIKYGYIKMVASKNHIKSLHNKRSDKDVVILSPAKCKYVKSNISITRSMHRGSRSSAHLTTPVRQSPYAESLLIPWISPQNLSTYSIHENCGRTTCGLVSEL